jgi:hypothetical protein
MTEGEDVRPEGQHGPNLLSLKLISDRNRV